MATITRENIGHLNDKLIVQVAKEDYLPSFEQSLKKYAKNANIPGFRKGMVPASMIKKMYGQSVFNEEVLRKVEKELNDFVVKEQLDIFAQPLPLDNDARMLDMNNPGDYAFAFEIGLKPNFDVHLDKVNVTHYKIEVAEKEIDEEVERLQKRHGHPAERDTITEDTNIITFLATALDAEGNKAENGFEKELTNAVRNFSEAFRPQLMGLKKEDTLKTTAQEAFEEKERADFFKKLELEENPAFPFAITIQSIQALENASVDESLFSAVYPDREIKTEEAFRNAIKAEIESYYESQAKNQMDDQIYHQLVDQTSIEVPETFLLRWLKEGGEKPKPQEEAEKEMPRFISQLKWSLISTKLITDNQVTVDPEEIKEQAKHQIMNYMGSQNLDDAPWLEDYANRMMKDQKFVEETYMQIQISKLFSILEKQVTQTPENISLEDFTKKMQEHHH